MFVVCESFSRCKGRGIFCCLQTFFCFFSWLVATGGGYRDRGGERVLNLSRVAAKHDRDGDRRARIIRTHRKTPGSGRDLESLMGFVLGRSGESGLFDHHLLTIDDVQTLGGSDDALA